MMTTATTLTTTTTATSNIEKKYLRKRDLYKVRSKFLREKMSFQFGVVCF